MMTMNMTVPAAILMSFTLPVLAGTWEVNTTEQWKASSSGVEGLELENDMAVPTGGTASFSSIVHKTDGKRKANRIVFSQSPEWKNWEPVAPVGPKNLGDAPIFLSLGPDNYWMFGLYRSPGGMNKKDKKNKTEGGASFEAKDATLEGFDIPLETTPDPNQFNALGGLKKGRGGYHAWQSKDMVNWVHHGPVTETFSKWATTAEYADGKLYIYYDYPNDQDPHVYIDDDLTDGEPGRNMGMAFADPSDGSDCAVIRDLDGVFHIIYEDWSPIDASKHSWDSPLAGHTASADGAKFDKILPPAVDYRTKPTGEIREYKHPHWLQHPDWDTNVAKYEVHEPGQDAYGDWAAISIGGQYYLFSDFHPAGTAKEMSTAMFTSSSIDKPFRYYHHVGRGHPDPDVGFAEGKFFLITQTPNDFVSPGPWVEKVEARAGVDTSNDGKIDQWTDWQEVKERYDHMDGFAKQIARTPAGIDLSGLPAGYGFAFEFRIEDTTSNESIPVMNSVTLTFAD